MVDLSHRITSLLQYASCLQTVGNSTAAFKYTTGNIYCGAWETFLRLCIAQSGAKTLCTHKVRDGIQLYNAPWFCCGLLTDDVEHLTNIFLKGIKQFAIM